MAPSHSISETDTPIHLQVFTYPPLTPIPSRQIFTLFPDLPIELQDEIWRLVLGRHQRVIKLRVWNRYLMDLLLEGKGEARPKSREAERYGVVVNGLQTLSKLFHVCRRSRDFALTFYRVHIPCWLVKGSSKQEVMRPGTLYFNPEADFLHLSINKFTPSDDSLALDFLYDLKTIHDPRNVGLLNLAVDYNFLMGLNTIDPASLDPSTKSIFTETLQQLRQVFFVQIQVAGCHVLGYFIGESPRSNQVNRAVPVIPMALNFRRFCPDPRPIARNLKRVYLDSNPHRMAHAWQRMLSCYLEHRKQLKTECRVLLACTSYTNKGFLNYEEGQQLLQKENDIWLKETVGDERSGRLLEEDCIQTAFGFWLFPIDGFTPSDKAPGFMDLSNAWPDLALVDVP
ncbi:hypothetical protein GGR55DRAFT_674420 [Xylaria sp. FL0064]|nr:hypothetical protein GGR55DRAFT_674420 [Xylaria sp. FL0064]